MSSFVTSDGKTRQIEITIGSIKRVKNAIGVDLVNADKPREGQELAVVSEIFMDTELLVSVLYWLLGAYDDDVKAMTLEQFEMLFSGEVLDKAHEVFFDMLKNFFRSTKKPILASAIEEQEKITKVCMRAQENQLSKLNLSEKVLKEAERLFGDLSATTLESLVPETSTA